MKFREIHDYLLSLFVRGLGIWLLYSAFSDRFITVLDHIYFALSSTDAHPDYEPLFFLVMQVVLAGYFVLGAPPFLKWATRGNANLN